MRILITLATLWFATAPSIAQDTPADWSGWWGGLSLGLAGASALPNGMVDDRFCFTTTEGDATAICRFGDSGDYQLSALASLGDEFFRASHDNGSINFEYSTEETFQNALAAASGIGFLPKIVMTMANLTGDEEQSRAFALYAQTPAHLHFQETATSGGSLGLHIRHDWQAQGLVYGVELDAAVMGNSAFFAPTTVTIAGPPDTLLSESLELGTPASLAIKGRWGHAYGQVLPYATAGLGMVHAQGILSKTVEMIVLHASSRETTSKLLVGPVVGAGIAWQPADGVALSAEALYYAVSDRFDFSDGQHAELRDVFTAKLGLSLRLN